MGYLLFCVYFFGFAWLLGKWRFFKDSGISLIYLRSYFGLKVAAAVLYGYLAVTAGGDTWTYHQYGLEEASLLRQNPGRFFAEIFAPGYTGGYGDFLGVRNSWWNDADGILMAKLLAVFNIASGGRYYVNAIFYAFLTLAGPVLLFKLARRQLPHAKSVLLYAPLLIPSVVFWTSGIHKEGLLLLALGLMLYSLDMLLIEKKFLLKYAVASIAGLLLILMLRNFMLLPLMAGLAAQAAAQKWPLKPWASFTAALAVAIVLFFGLRHISPKLDFPQALVARQAAFKQLEGRSKVATNPLEPNPASFVRNAPQAFATAVFRPWPPDVYNLRIGLAAAETVLICLLLLAAPIAYFKYLKQKVIPPYFIFCLLFSVLLLLIIGYTVPFLGAIVRYRSIVYPFLMLPVFWAVLNKRENSRR